MTNSGVTAGGVQGKSDPLTLLTGKFLMTYREKRGKEKRENGEEKKQNRKREGLKIENGRRKSDKKLQTEERTFFFLFCFGSTKREFSTEEKYFTPSKKSGKITLPPLNKILLRPWWQTTF